jgi:protein-tyrosine phosphatase
MHAVTCSLRQPVGELTVDTALALCGGLLRLLRQGERIALCCDTTSSRTALIVSALLLWMGRPLQEALATFQQLGAPPVESPERVFLAEFQKALAHRELVGPSWNRRYAL